MENQEKSKRLVVMGFLTLATVLIWVAFDSYRELIKKDRIEKLDYLLEPIKPELKFDVVDKVGQKKEYQIKEVDNLFQISTPTPAETATESGEQR